MIFALKYEKSHTFPIRPRSSHNLSLFPLKKLALWRFTKEQKGCLFAVVYTDTRVTRSFYRHKDIIFYVAQKFSRVLETVPIRFRFVEMAWIYSKRRQLGRQTYECSDRWRNKPRIQSQSKDFVYKSIARAISNVAYSENEAIADNFLLRFLPQRDLYLRWWPLCPVFSPLEINICLLCNYFLISGATMGPNSRSRIKEAHTGGMGLMKFSQKISFEAGRRGLTCHRSAFRAGIKRYG